MIEKPACPCTQFLAKWNIDNYVNMSTTLRPATKYDAEFIARNIFMAFLVDMSEYSPEERDSLVRNMAAVCRREDTFYSWRNTIIAESDGQPAGVAIAYDGARYKEMRQATIPLIVKFMTVVFGIGFENMPDEAGPGEFYLDTLAVKPEMRHRGIASDLMKAVVESAREKGIPLCTLAVDPVNDKARSLYGQMGFQESHMMRIFGEDYIIMARKLVTGNS